MSIDIRHITNGVKSGYYVRNARVEPMPIDIYNQKEDIPKSIRHYAKDGEPVYWGPDMARIMGCQKLLYPDFPLECGYPEYTGQICIGESCIYAVDGDWEKCHYAKKWTDSQQF